MAEQRIHDRLGTFDTLNKEEMSSALWDHVQHSEMARLAGMKVIRFPPVTAISAGGTLSLYQPANGAQVGPDSGFIWEVQRVTVASANLLDQANYAIYFGSDPTFNPLHLIDNGLPAAAPFTTPAVPATTVAQQNPAPYPVTVVVAGGTVSAVTVNGIAVGAGDGSYVVPIGGTIAVTYSAAPTWTWTGLGVNPSGGVSVNRAWYPSKHSAWLYGGEQVYTQVYATTANTQYTMTGIALEVPAEMQGKIM